MMTSMNKKMAAVVLAVTVAMSLSACSNWLNVTVIPLSARCRCTGRCGINDGSTLVPSAARQSAGLSATRWVNNINHEQ